MEKLIIFSAILLSAVVGNSGFFLDNLFERNADPLQSISTFDGNRNTFGSNDLDDIFQTRSDVAGGYGRHHNSLSYDSKSEFTTPVPTPTAKPSPSRPTRRRSRSTRYRTFDNDRPFDAYARSRKRKGFFDKY